MARVKRRVTALIPGHPLRPHRLPEVKRGASDCPASVSFRRPCAKLAIGRNQRLRLDDIKGCNQPMSGSAHYPRFAASALSEALEDSPVVLVHGPRQCGKTTLVRELGDRHKYDYLTFDNDVTRAAAEADPVGSLTVCPSAPSSMRFSGCRACSPASRPPSIATEVPGASC